MHLDEIAGLGDQGLVALVGGQDAPVAGEGVETEVDNQQRQGGRRQEGAKTSEPWAGIA